MIDLKFSYNKFILQNELQRYGDSIRKHARIVLKENACGCMYDLIGSTMPFPKGSQTGGGTLSAFNNAMTSWQHTISKAFQPIQSVPFGTYVMNKDYRSIMKYGFVFENEILQKAMDEHNFDVIYNAFEKAGWVSDESIKVKDDATMADLIEFRSKFSGTFKYILKSDATLIRNKESITKLRNAKNQMKIGWMAGGWLKCALELGKKCDKYTKDRLPVWMYGKGSGYITVSSDGLTIICYNSYGNFGGWMSSSPIQEVLRKRQMIINRCGKDSFKEILNEVKK